MGDRHNMCIKPSRYVSEGMSYRLLPVSVWRRRPGSPSNQWIDQVRRDNNNIPPADLWRRSIAWGHSGVTLRSLPTTR